MQTKRKTHFFLIQNFKRKELDGKKKKKQKKTDMDWAESRIVFNGVIRDEPKMDWAFERI